MHNSRASTSLSSARTKSAIVATAVKVSACTQFASRHPATTRKKTDIALTYTRTTQRVRADAVRFDAASFAGRLRNRWCIEALDLRKPDASMTIAVVTHIAHIQWIYSIASCTCMGELLLYTGRRSVNFSRGKGCYVLHT